MKGSRFHHPKKGTSRIARCMGIPQKCPKQYCINNFRPRNYCNLSRMLFFFPTDFLGIAVDISARSLRVILLHECLPHICQWVKKYFKGFLDLGRFCLHEILEKILIDFHLTHKVEIGKMDMFAAAFRSIKISPNSAVIYHHCR